MYYINICKHENYTSIHFKYNMSFNLVQYVGILTFPKVHFHVTRKSKKIINNILFIRYKLRQYSYHFFKLSLHHMM